MITSQNGMVAPEQPTVYVPDFDKIDSLDKLKAIVLSFGYAYDSNHPMFGMIESLLTPLNPENQIDIMKEQMESLGLQKANQSQIISLDEIF